MGFPDKTPNHSFDFLISSCILTFENWIFGTGSKKILNHRWTKNSSSWISMNHIHESRPWRWSYWRICPWRVLRMFYFYSCVFAQMLIQTQEIIISGQNERSMNQETSVNMTVHFHLNILRASEKTFKQRPRILFTWNHPRTPWQGGYFRMVLSIGYF